MKRYTDAEKAEAVELYRTEGPTAVQKQLGIPKGTVTRWAQAVGAETVSVQHTQAAVSAARAKWAERRALMVDEIGTVAHMALMQAENAVVEGHGRNAKDFATTMAILVDKAQLLDGQATSRFDFGRHRANVSEDAEHGALRLVG